MKTEIEDTYAEVFDGLYIRIIVTADDEMTLRGAAQQATSTPSIVIGRVEGGIEKYLDRSSTPDKRPGAILQFWSGLDEKKPLKETIDKFYKEFSYRIRQDILVRPFTTVFDACRNPIARIDAMERIGHCGDGYEWIENRYGREMIIIPLMVPDFMIERFLGYGKGITGGNFWYFCKTKEAVMKGGKKALDAIRQIGNFAAHPTKHKTTGLIVEVEPEEASWTLDVLEDLFEFYYVQPKRAAEKRNRLEKKLKSVGKPPLKKP